MSELKSRMEKTVEATKESLGTLRTGRAKPELLSKIQVSCYGSMTPLQQVASISVPEPMMLQLNVFDRTVVQEVEKAIMTSDLNLNPSSDGSTIRLRLPDLTEERRQELVKIAKKYIEDGKVAIRNIRRDHMDFLKEQEKENEISEDELKREQDDTQKITDNAIKNLDETFQNKEKEILTV